MQYHNGYEVETKTRLTPGEREEVGKFLSGMGLLLEDDLDETVIVRDAKKIIATGSSSGCVIKCMAVNPEIRGKNLSGIVAGKLLQDLYHRGKSDIFVFTKPENRDVFENLGFYEIYGAKGDALLMENNPSGFASYQFCHIRVFLLRHDAAAGAECIRYFNKSKLRG